MHVHPLPLPSPAPCRRGQKLDCYHISSLVYALGLGLGLRKFPTAPPDHETLTSARCAPALTEDQAL